MWPIIRDAIAGASPEVRAQLRWIVGFWITLVTAQIWDSRNASGAAGVAEFLSALLGASGLALLGFAHMLNLTMREAPCAEDPRTRWKPYNVCCSRCPPSDSLRGLRSVEPPSSCPYGRCSALPCPSSSQESPCTVG